MKNIEIINCLKETLNYREVHQSCKSCIFYRKDESTDNFGSGDKCNRNPDLSFGVKEYGVCDMYTPKRRGVM